MAIRTSAGHGNYRTIAGLLLIPLLLVVIAKNPDASASVLQSLIHILAVLVSGLADVVGGLLGAFTSTG